MMKLVIGTALGFLIAQALVHGLRQLRARRGGAVRAQIRRPAPVPAQTLISGFVRYAPPIAFGAALVTLGAWSVKDHLAARRAGKVQLSEALSPTGSGQLADPGGAADDFGMVHASGGSEARATDGATPIDPYSDPDFKVPPRRHRAAGESSLKDALVERSEAKARVELLRDTREQRNRSQYDCEAAVRAKRYLDAGLDVWGFAAWQLKYFPVAGYKGAKLPECRDIKDVVDPSRLNLQSTVAQGNRS